MANERFMRHNYGPSGFVDKAKQEEHRCPACGNTKIPKPEWWAVKEFRDKIMAYVQNRRLEFREVAESSNKHGLEAKKLAAECRELAYFDVVKEIERIEVELAFLYVPRTKGNWEP